MGIIRVLHVFGGLDSGGAENRTMDIYRQIDKEKVQFDFLVHTDKVGFFEEEIQRMGGKVYRVPRFNLKTVFAYQRELKSFFESNTSYQIIHGHILSTAFIYHRIAKKNGIPVRIAHSRCGTRTEVNFENIIKEIFKRLARFYVTDKFSVSKIAGVSAFGKRNVRLENVKILPNAIEVSKYSFNVDIRKKIRENLKIDNKMIIGHIGRFQKQKNHKFLVEVFYEIQKLNKNALLMLIGDGELKEDVKDQIQKLGISDKVIFTGVRADVPDLLQAMDVLLFPSFYEGLPGVVLEAQSAALPCIISDRITEEVKITDLVKFVSLKEDAKSWANYVLNLTENFYRKDITKEIIDAGYDIKSVSKWYESFYLMNQ